MDDVVAVQHIERAAGIGAQPQCPYRINALPTKIIQRPSIDVVHDEVGPAVIEGADVVDLNQPAVMNPPHDSRLGEKTAANVAVARPVVGEHLDGHGYVQVIVMAEPHRCERSGTEAPNQPIPPNGVHRNHSHSPARTCESPRVSCASFLTKPTCT
jgi:hypothetical protein